ncbi:uncharacterized protein [Chironomus tepperi]|uniref:uncharacterized protein n=1 Tax=Chironomus tepperi TaxID=113505 RepID=UPI00391FC48E
MGTQTRTAEALERKIEKHIKEHADDMKNLKTEIQSLKIMKPKIQKDHRPFNDNKRVTANAKNENYRKMSAKPLKNLQNSSKATMSTTTTTLNNFGDKMTNKMDLLNHHHQQHHPNDDEHLKTNNGLYQTESLCTLNSYNNTVMSMAESVMTKINYNGSVMPSPVSPIKLLQFLIMELKTKLKDYVAEDDVQIPKILNEINYAIKHVMLERKLNKSKTSQMMEINEISSNDINYTSKDTQTDLKGDDVEKFVDFQDKYFTLQAEMDVNLRRMEDVFTMELKKSDEKITKLRDDINVMQTSFSNGIKDKNLSISHQIDLKMEEIKGEMKFLIGMFGETKNHNLIDNLSKKLAQTQKKIDDVKIKCTETAKNCLQMHVENHLIKSHASQTKQIGCELGQIKNEVWREIQALKNVLTTADDHDNESMAQQCHQLKKNNKMFEESKHFALSSSSLLSSTASSIYDKSDASISDKISTKSIKSSIKLNEKEKMSKMMRECYDDKFSIKIDDIKDNDNSMAEHDDCDEEQNNITDASIAEMMSKNI